MPTAAQLRIAAARDLGRHASAVVLDALRVRAGALLAGAALWRAPLATGDRRRELSYER